MDQQFFRGRSASNPSTNARARRRGSTRLNCPATRPISSSNNPAHRPGSTLWPAATARSSRVHTTRDDHGGGRSTSSTATPKITNYCWSIRPTGRGSVVSSAEGWQEGEETDLRAHAWGLKQ